MAAVLAPNAAVAAAAGEPDRAAIDRFVTEFAGNAGYPDVTVAITKGDRVVHVAGYGRGDADVTATTPMPVASVSKSFTALAVMQLVERGAVALDRPVADYLPDFHLADPRAAGITVRRLLNQTSGISDRTLREKSLPQPDSLADAVPRANAATLAVDPGTRHHYTNTNYHLAGRLVEVVSGEPYADYLRRHVFEPAGMRSTTTITHAPGGVTKGHVYAYGASIPATEPHRLVAGSDGVVSTAEDMARWLVVQSNGGRTADGTRLVSPESVKAMHTSSDPRWTYGMGWDTSEDGRVRHSGIWFTHSAGQLLLPSGYGIAVTASSGVALGNEGTGALEDGLATLLEGGVPDTGSSLRLVIDLVLAALTVLSLVLCFLALRRSARWAATPRPGWQRALRLLPRLVPLVFLVTMSDLVGLVVGGGRDISGVQLAYYSPALVTWLTVSAVGNGAVLVTRFVALVRPRRSPPVVAG
ncbi:CubicO group peptidase (beta-lactamase class C family) [Saccharothrix tamanrassetensis]|uniref:CubicO group peptidase (Beta-lactamase class C family) n=1 Tax=Saccharothrix tamanrassetensis TaxID=1051531 RepID=A0A841CKK0_9PSEU|nr:serine hydrolase domain-containing protein [Saccharothrix tamanrassetensis]MBB5957463.1 CubicO group peptidase (beta-lactamase class C family) [Saccharothrix tamanrassetensis]